MNTTSHLQKGTLLFLLLLSYTFTAYAQDSTCVDVVQKAEQAYFNTQFERAISFLDPCIAEIEEEEQLTEAYLLLSRVHFSMQNTSEAENAIQNLLSIDPAFTLPAYLPPPYIRFYEHIQERDQQHYTLAEKLREAPEYIPPSMWQKIDRHWYWVGGGVLAAATAAFLIDSDLEPVTFAPPPGPPGGESAIQ